MSLEKVTKEIFDETFKEAITNVEQQLQTLSKTYIALLQMRTQYRKDYKTNRLIHQIDFDKGVITYKLGASRKLGYDYKNRG